MYLMSSLVFPLPSVSLEGGPVMVMRTVLMVLMSTQDNVVLGPAALQSSAVGERWGSVCHSPGCVTSMRTARMDLMRGTARSRKNVPMECLYAGVDPVHRSPGDVMDRMTVVMGVMKKGVDL